MGWFPFLPSKSCTTYSVVVGDKTVNVNFTANALNALNKRKKPLLVEIELVFACIAHKRVRFPDWDPSAESIALNPQLALLFTTLIPNQTSSGDDIDTISTPSLKLFYPKQIHIDYKNGNWSGEYGF